jgi:thiol-disulfide isomerase/thioredoxin
LVLLSRGSVEANLAKATEHGIERVLLQRDYEIAETYQALGTPSGVLIRPDGHIDSLVAPGAEAIRALVAQVTGRPVPNPANAQQNGRGAEPTRQRQTPVAVGEPAPTLELRDLTGRTVSMAAFMGHKIALLFWNPDCGYCKQLLPRVKSWEHAAPEGAPKLLVVSAGAVEANRAMDFRSPVLLDTDFLAGRAFGAGGTPSAVLIDEQGKVASELKIGGDAVLGLIGAALRA